MTNTIKMKVDEKKLIANMKDAFTNDYSVITELAQNARRAGATKVEFTTDGLVEHYDYSYEATEFNLTVTDDGAGVSDLQSMLSVASSGWDEKTLQDENPFGMGFLMAIYLSKSITVQSKGKKFTATREQLLNLEDITIEEGNVTAGTEIVLTGLELYGIRTLEMFTKKLEDILCCFPITVLHNKVDVKRYYTREKIAADADYMLVENSRCDIFIRKDIRLDYSNSCVVSFQGLIVEKDSNFYSYSNSYSNSTNSKVDFVIFAKSSMGTIRLPDRSQFVDHKEVYSFLSGKKDAAITALVNSRKDDFKFLCNNLDRLSKYGCLHLLNEHKQLPSSLVNTFSSGIVNAYENYFDLTNFEDDSFTGVDSEITLDKDTLSKYILINEGYNFHDGFSIMESDSEKNFSLAMLLHKMDQDYLLIKAHKLHKEHWIRKLCVDFVDVAETVKVEATNYRKPTVDPAWQDFSTEYSLKMCDAYSITAKLGERLLESHDLTEDACIAEIDDRGVALIPPGVKWDIISQISCYVTDGEMVDENLRSQWERGFNKWLVNERSANDPIAYFKNVLKDVQFEHLNGKSFHLNINDGVIEINQI